LWFIVVAGRIKGGRAVIDQRDLERLPRP